jgi:hypothetical protein
MVNVAFGLTHGLATVTYRRVKFETKYRHNFGQEGIDSCGKDLLGVQAEEVRSMLTDY